MSLGCTQDVIGRNAQNFRYINWQKYSKSQKVGCRWVYSRTPSRKKLLSELTNSMAFWLGGLCFVQGQGLTSLVSDVVWFS